MKPVEVLLVEDNAGDVLLVRRTLAEGPVPVNLHLAQDGEQALQVLSDPDFTPDLIILDLNLPRVPGSTVLERYQSKKTPIIIFSSSWNDIEVRRAKELGACEFVQKPIELEAFTAAISGMIARWVLPHRAEGAAGSASS